MVVLKVFRPAWIALPFLLLAFGLRLYHLDYQSIWWDEGHSIDMASAPLSQIATLPGMDVHPPGYFISLHVWMTLTGRHEFGLRYLSVVFSVLTVALLMRFARACLPRSPGYVLAGILAAISPLYVAYAQEVRMYAMLTCFILISGYAQWRIVGGEKRSAGQLWRALWWGCYVIATVLSLYIHYFTVFWLVFQNLAWLMWAGLSPAGAKRRTRLGLWIGSQIALTLLYLPQLGLALRQTTAYANPNLNTPGVVEFLSRTWLAYTLGLTSYPEVTWLAELTAGLTLLIGAALLWRAHRLTSRNSWAMAAFLAGWFGVPLVVYYLVLLVRPSFEPRYLMFVTPALFLGWTWGIVGLYQDVSVSPKLGVRLRQVASKGVAVAISVLLAASLGMGTYGYFTYAAAFKDDSAGVVAWLAAHTTAHDIVYVDVPHPFHYYAERIPAPTRYLFVDVHRAAQILSEETVGRERVYWVTWWGSDTDPRGVIPFLLDKAARRLGDLDFRGYHVIWWELQPELRFSLPNDLVSADVVFGNVIRLDGLAYAAQVRAGEAGWVTAHFRLLGKVSRDFRVSIRLQDAQGVRQSQTDRDLLNDRHLRTSAWPLEDDRLNQAINVYTLPVPTAALPGNYDLLAVIYDAVSQEALPVTAGTNVDGMQARLGRVLVTP